MTRKLVFQFSLFLILLGIFITTQALAKPERIKITSKPVSFSLVDKTKKQFDKLIYLGGLELFSENKHFGGISGIVVSPDGQKMIAVSDRGRWFGADLIYKNGKINGLKNVLFSRLTDTSGHKLRGKDNRDSESITTARSPKLSGGVIVAYERKEKLYLYKTRDTKILPGAIKIPVPEDIKSGPHNKELETVVRFHTGRLRNKILIVSENNRNDENNIKAWLLSDRRSSPLSIRAWGNFYVTDAAELPNGDVLILERALSPLTGLSMQIRLIREKEIKPGAILDGPILLQASQLMMIDNMEGLSVHQDKDKRQIITIISDDNFNKYQRTLLLQFEIPKHLLSNRK